MKLRLLINVTKLESSFNSVLTEAISFSYLDKSISSISNAFVVFFFGNKYYLNEIDLVYSTDNKEKYSSRYNNIKTKTKSGHLISLRHFCFGVLLVRNPWSTLAFYFQSSLNWAVNYIPVLTIPPVFVAEFF